MIINDSDCAKRRRRRPTARTTVTTTTMPTRSCSYTPTPTRTPTPTPTPPTSTTSMPILLLLLLLLLQPLPPPQRPAATATTKVVTTTTTALSIATTVAFQYSRRRQPPHVCRCSRAETNQAARAYLSAGRGGTTFLSKAFTGSAAVPAAGAPVPASWGVAAAAAARGACPVAAWSADTLAVKSLCQRLFAHCGLASAWKTRATRSDLTRNPAVVHQIEISELRAEAGNGNTAFCCSLCGAARTFAKARFCHN